MATFQAQNSPSAVRVQVRETPKLAVSQDQVTQTSSTAHRRHTYGIHTCLWVDLLINIIFDYGWNKVGYIGVTLGFQLLLVFVWLTLVYQILKQTYPFRTGLLGLLMHDFRHLIVSAFMYLLFLLMFRIEQQINLSKHGETNVSTDLWYHSFDYLVLICHKLSMIWFYIELSNFSFAVSSPMYFKQDGWLERLTQ
eukprot:TRINITY_DN10565_c0_g2_i3.p1 TRINITY_DN10565_c0_g2~~TRINITY_DN10565_c0_g2_i3.p1  ORF type:complete len:195 (+),score=27.40 TRINITY_DN10565_c0_g2_i3:130-714(+)